MTRSFFLRVLRFYTVGASGLMVQIASLSILYGMLQLSLAAATALAVEMAILNNFVWHVRWTWAARMRVSPPRDLLHRLLKFNLTSGLLSIGVNVALTTALASALHIHYLAANLIATGLGAVANFAISECLVFRSSGLVSGASLLSEVSVRADANPRGGLGSSSLRSARPGADPPYAGCLHEAGA